MKRRPKLTAEEQRQRFIDAAREAGVDEQDEAALERVLRHAAKATKKPKTPRNPS